MFIKRKTPSFSSLKKKLSPKGTKFDMKRFRKGVQSFFGRKVKLVSTADEPKIRPRATEMYRAYRFNTGPLVLAAEASVDTQNGISDDGRGKPKVAIEQSSERIYRAHKLLEKEKKRMLERQRREAFVQEAMNKVRARTPLPLP